MNAVSPGYTRTTRSRPLPADVAVALLYLQSGRAAFVSGQVVVVDGGISARPAYE